MPHTPLAELLSQVPALIKDIMEETAPTRDAAGRHVIVDRYALINTVDRLEAARIKAALGIDIPFAEGESDVKPTIGKGNFGAFRLAYDVHTQQYLGVKKLKSERAINESCLELVMGDKLKGKPYIIPLDQAVLSQSYRGGKKTEQTVLYLFMPLAGLGSVEKLREQLSQMTDIKLKERVIIHLMKGLLQGLWQMHQAGIYHLDIKPDNLVVDSEGQVFIIDLGCAVEIKDKVPALVRGEEAVEDLKLEVGKGSKDYFSQARDEADQHKTSFNCAKADLYAAGQTLLELLTGRHYDYYDSYAKSEDLQKLLPQTDGLSLAHLAAELLDEKADSAFTLLDALNWPVFQSPDVHDEAVMGTAIDYLRQFVQTTTLVESVKRRLTDSNAGKADAGKAALRQSGLTRSRGAEAAEDPTRLLAKAVKRLLDPAALPPAAEALSRYVPLQASTDREGKKAFELEDKINDWLASDKTVLLLLADGGSGKSTFCLRQTYRRLADYQQTVLTEAGALPDFLPLYVPLANIAHPKRLLGEVLETRYGLNTSQIQLLKHQQKFLLLLDGYDELKDPTNLYVANQLKDWQVKVLVTCRPSSLGSDYQTLFLPYQQGKNAFRLFEQWYVQPFSPERIEAYVKRYIDTEQTALQAQVDQGELDARWLKADTYQAMLQQLGLGDLVKNPYLLRLTMEGLPALSQQQEQATQPRPLEAVDVYEQYLTLCGNANG